MFKINPKIIKISPKMLNFRQIDPEISKKFLNYCKKPTQNKKRRTYPPNPTASPQTYLATLNDSFWQIFFSLNDSFWQIFFSRPICFFCNNFIWEKFLFGKTFFFVKKSFFVKKNFRQKKFPPKKKNSAEKKFSLKKNFSPKFFLTE